MNGETTSLIVDTDLETKTFAPVRLRWMSRAESWPYLGLVSASMPLSGSIRTSYIAELLTHLLLTSLSDPPFPPHPPPQLPLLIMPPNLLVVLHQTGRSWWWHIHHLEKSLWVALSDNEVILLLSYLLETFVIFLLNMCISLHICRL